MGAVTVGYVAAPAPLLVVASLAGGDEVDATTGSYLLKAALKKEEEGRKVRLMQEIHRKVRADEAVTDAKWAAWKAWRGIGSSSSGGQKRKRKKRRKRRTPRTSSCSLRGRARRRQRQWHACNAGCPGDVPLLAVFLPVVYIPVMLGIMAVLGQKDSGMCKARFAGIFTSR